MQAERVEVSWDTQKSKWLVRIINGEEVIRRYSKLPKNADDQKLRTAAAQTAQDEGYEADAAKISVNH
jgi:hypothetical protein